MKLCWIKRFDSRGLLVIPSISQLQLAGIENQRNIPSNFRYPEITKFRISNFYQVDPQGLLHFEQPKSARTPLSLGYFIYFCFR